MSLFDIYKRCDDAPVFLNKTLNLLVREGAQMQSTLADMIKSVKNEQERCHRLWESLHHPSNSKFKNRFAEAGFVLMRFSINIDISYNVSNSPGPGDVFHV